MLCTIIRIYYFIASYRDAMLTKQKNPSDNITKHDKVYKIQNQFITKWIKWSSSRGLNEFILPKTTRSSSA